MSKKSVKFAKAQRPSGASTSAEHPSTAKEQGYKSKGKGPSTGTIMGASLLAVGAGVLIALTRRSWPIKQAQEAATGLFKGKSQDNKDQGQGQAVKGVDPDLSAEVANATQSSPQNEGNFTDEGATGNND
ncbi:hypothetical protein [Hymenobacter sp. CRA2]|uniref:hypothetical protein n=1 Tax=Hymenobacter sp. CRA2 TaxID=1955620 RepID=UPI00098F8C81|nr:hypothetical protein [Hymenobacter sp. CRA2]OON68477.1 hypothetical protein B0919_12580 [Hymenobacter sp. CRA2]